MPIDSLERRLRGRPSILLRSIDPSRNKLREGVVFPSLAESWGQNNNAADENLP